MIALTLTVRFAVLFNFAKLCSMTCLGYKQHESIGNKACSFYVRRPPAHHSGVLISASLPLFAIGHFGI